MYLKFIGVLILFSFSCVEVICQSLDVEWEKKLGKSGADAFDYIIEDRDGGFTVVGSVQSSNENNFDFWMVRFSPDGVVDIDKSFGTEWNDFSSCVSQFPNGDYIIAGRSVKPDSVNHILLLKVGSGGSEIWKRNIDFEESTVVKNIIAMEDGSFVTSGTRNLSESSEEIWVAQFSNECELLWEKTFGEKGNARAETMRKLPDGGFVVAGRIVETTLQDADLYLLRFNKEGDKLWDKQFLSPNINVWPECVCCSPDNNFMVVGWYGTCMNNINSENPIFDYDLFLCKISPDGNMIWSRNIDSEGSEGGNAIVVRPDGKMLIAGKKETSFMGRVGTWLLLADEKGSVITETVFPYNFENDKAVEIINSSDGGFVVVGPGEIDSLQRNSNGWIKKFKAF